LRFKGLRTVQPQRNEKIEEKAGRLPPGYL